ncbi:MAG: hypothetical protein LBD23_11815, partial [Oscillospiraceae bacterium]|nr:hypothetical protein [Oscillospiraceae bacterium]
MSDGNKTPEKTSSRSKKLWGRELIPNIANKGMLHDISGLPNSTLLSLISQGEDQSSTKSGNPDGIRNTLNRRLAEQTQQSILNNSVQNTDKNDPNDRILPDAEIPVRNDNLSEGANLPDELKDQVGELIWQQSSEEKEKHKDRQLSAITGKRGTLKFWAEWLGITTVTKTGGRGDSDEYKNMLMNVNSVVGSLEQTVNAENFNDTLNSYHTLISSCEAYIKKNDKWLRIIRKTPSGNTRLEIAKEILNVAKAEAATLSDNEIEVINQPQGIKLSQLTSQKAQHKKTNLDKNPS